MIPNGTIQSAVDAAANLNLGSILGKSDFGFNDLEGIQGVGEPEATPAAETSEPEKVDTQAGGTRLTDKPAKKAYDTPFVPRGQYFKMLREQGLLKPRQPKAKADQKSDEPKAAKAKAPKQASAPKTEKPVRSAKQLAAIRGSYARKRAAAKAAQTA